jgi:hypothetical protein
MVVLGRRKMTRQMDYCHDFRGHETGAVTDGKQR